MSQDEQGAQDQHDQLGPEDDLPAEEPLDADLTDSEYDKRRKRAREQQRRRRSGRPGSSRRGGSSGSAPGSSSGLPPQEDPEVLEAARNIVLRQLTSSAKSRRQLEDKLADRDIPEAAARAVLDRFEQVDLVDDRAFATSYVRQRAESRKLARPLLRRELQQRGVEQELVEEALEQRTDEDERGDALQLVRRKLPSGPGLQAQLADREAKQKLIRRLVAALARKGYAPGLAFEVVREVLAEQGTTDDGMLQEPDSL